MGNVIPFPGRSGSVETSITSTPSDEKRGAILDVTERIAANQSEDRRQVKRVVLNEFISAHVYVAGRGLLRVTLKDIHENGLAFEIDEREGNFIRGEQLEMRFYMNHETYFKFNVQVAHHTFNPDEQTHRHGCQYASDTINDVALHHFIGFLQNISASLKTDRGDRVVSNIYS